MSTPQSTRSATQVTRGKVLTMICFEDLFLESGGTPVVYEGNTLVMKDDFPMEGCRRFRLVFEACNGEWRQGAYLCVEGSFVVNQQTVEGGIALWEDTAPASVQLETDTDAQTIEVRNVWDVGDGVMHSWHNGQL
jgi:hypothetical protein